MALPAQLQKEFVAEFKREPHIVLRAICDLTGMAGLVTVLAEMLTPAQRRCVLANVLHEAWHDGEPPAEVGAAAGPTGRRRGHGLSQRAACPQ